MTSGGSGRAVHLRIDVAVRKKEVLPAAIGKIDEGVAPANKALRSARNARRRWSYP